MGKMSTAGIILAAGFSSRMKDFKPLMKIGEKTPLEMLTLSMNIAGIDQIYVVTGYRSEDIEKALDGTETRIIRNSRFEEGMFTSIQAGVAAASGDGHSCFIINPVDIPLIPPYIFKLLLKKHLEEPGKFLTPCFEGRHGHPLLVPGIFAGEIADSNGEQGMKSVTGAHPGEMSYLDTNCESILMDMDTKEAYEALLEYYENHRIPDEDMCRKIYLRCGTPEHVIRHCEAVTEAATVMGEELNKAGMNLSIPLIRASGLLHDCLRTMPKHWDAGAERVMDYGYPEVADIVQAHMDYLHPLPVDGVTEKDLICLADKLCEEDHVVTLRDRLSPALEKFKDNPEIVKKVKEKINVSSKVLNYIEEYTGSNMCELIRAHMDEIHAARGNVRRVVLIRHGETERHSEKIFLGQTDVSLSAEGREQCEYVGYEMNHFKLNTRTVYCSDLKRATESAEIIAARMEGDIAVEPVPEFREMSLGSWDGKFMSEIRKEDPEGFEARGADLLNYRIDGDAENFQDLYDRVIPGFRRLVNETSGDLIIVSHSGVLRVILCFMEGRELSQVLNMKFDRGTYRVKEFNGDSELFKEE